MAEPSGREIKNALKLVKEEARRKLGKDWSLIIGNEGGLCIEARKVSGGITQSVSWRDGRLETRTFAAK